VGTFAPAILGGRLILLFLAMIAVHLASTSSARGDLSFSAPVPLAPDDPMWEAVGHRATDDPPLLFDPPVVDFGEIGAGELAWTAVRVINASETAITDLKVVSTTCSIGAGLGSPLEPGASAVLTFTIRAPSTQGTAFHKRATFFGRNVKPHVLDINGRITLAVHVEPAVITAPSLVERLRDARQGPTLDLGRLAPHNAYLVPIRMTNESDRTQTVTSIGSDIHDVPGWVDGAATIGPGESCLLQLPFLAPGFGRAPMRVEEGWAIQFEGGEVEMVTLFADLSPPPALLFESDVIDVGEIGGGSTKEIPIRAANVSGRHLRISRVDFSGSILPAWSPEELAPLESATILCRWNAPKAKDHRTTYERRVVIHLEDEWPAVVLVRATVPAAAAPVEKKAP
jgi:hypothetical protein